MKMILIQLAVCFFVLILQGGITYWRSRLGNSAANMIDAMILWLNCVPIAWVFIGGVGVKFHWRFHDYWISQSDLSISCFTGVISISLLANLPFSRGAAYRRFMWIKERTQKL